MKKRNFVIIGIIMVMAIMIGHHVWNEVCIPAKLNYVSESGWICTVNYMGKHTDRREGNVHLIGRWQVEQTYWLGGKQHYIVREDDGCVSGYQRDMFSNDIICGWVNYVNGIH